MSLKTDQMLVSGHRWAQLAGPGSDPSQEPAERSVLNEVIVSENPHV